VQFHIRDLAGELELRGHYVSVLAPAEEDTELPANYTSAGRAIPVKYNGSVARLCFGPRAAAKTKRWLEDNRFDVIHPHEPIVPSVAMLALWQTTTPVVATFHSAQLRSRALQIAFPMLRPSLEKIDARIAVSDDARRTIIEHLGGDAIVIPNGVSVANFSTATPQPQYSGVKYGGATPTIAFLGRLNEPRKGLDVLVKAVPQILQSYPDAKFFIAGKGDEGEAEAKANLGQYNAAVQFLGGLSDKEKAEFLKSVDIFVAPQTGGESFGIVLVEAMSAGAAVVASDMGAFRRVLDEGQAGWLFRTGNAEDLARTVISALSDNKLTFQKQLAATNWVGQFDWSNVASQIEAVYEMVIETKAATPPGDLADRVIQNVLERRLGANANLGANDD
jgi:phosphatidylinositol alpha-mannosyltransferase